MKTNYKAICTTLATLSLASTAGWAQRKDVNYDESKVQAYTLPALLTTEGGQQVTTISQWERQRRPELLDLFSSQMYGRTPTDPIAVRYEVLTENPRALGGKATSRQVKVLFSNGTKTLEALLLLFLPNNRATKVPTFVGDNFKDK